MLERTQWSMESDCEIISLRWVRGSMAEVCQLEPNDTTESGSC